MSAKRHADGGLGGSGIAQDAAQSSGGGQNHQHAGDGLKRLRGKPPQQFPAMLTPGLDVTAQRDQRGQYGDQQRHIRAAHKVQSPVDTASRRGQRVGPTTQEDERHRQQDGRCRPHGTCWRGYPFVLRNLDFGRMSAFGILSVLNRFERSLKQYRTLLSGLDALFRHSSAPPQGQEPA